MNKFLKILRNLKFKFISALILFGLIATPIFVLTADENSHDDAQNTLETKEEQGIFRDIIYGITGLVDKFAETRNYTNFFESLEHIMGESNEFCGFVCHKVMMPEYRSFKNSQHKGVHCVSCHIGGYMGNIAIVKARGVRQADAYFFKEEYPKPIHVPVKDLFPVRQTCNSCHPVEKTRASKFKQYKHFMTDNENSRVQSTLILRLGSTVKGSENGIHWHASPTKRVEFVSDHDKRLKINWVKLTLRDQEMMEMLILDAIEKQLIDPRLNLTYEQIEEILDKVYSSTHTPWSTIREQLEEMTYGDRFDAISDVIHYERGSDLDIAEDTTSFRTELYGGMKADEIKSIRLKAAQAIYDIYRNSVQVTKEWTRAGVDVSLESKHKSRVMDCTDCHNRVGHDFKTMEEAIDDAIKDGKIDKRLPFIKQQAKLALSLNYESHGKAATTIRKYLRDYYQKQRNGKFKNLAEKSIEAIVGLHYKNVDPFMNIKWGTYPDHAGHEANPQAPGYNEVKEFRGCYRCHNESLIPAQTNRRSSTKDKGFITVDCNKACHRIVEQWEKSSKNMEDFFPASESQ